MRLHASGVCHSDQNAIDGTAETRCPAVLGHEGAGVVEAIGAGVTAVAPGDRVALSWLPACGVCEECRRDLPHLCEAAFPAMDAGGLLDGTSRLSRDGEPVYHYSLLSTFAERTVVPEASCIPIGADVPFAVAALVGCAVTTGVCAAWRTARVAPGDRVAVFGCGGVGLSAVMGAAAAGAAAGRGRRRQPRAGPGGGRVRRHRGGRLGCRHADATAELRARGVGWRRRPRLRGHRPARGDAGGVPLDPPPRPGGADGHPPARRRPARARPADPARRAARDRSALRLVPARARLPADPRRLPARPPPARPADLAPPAAGRDRAGVRAPARRRRPPRRARAGARRSAA